MATWDDILSGIGDFSSFMLETSPQMAYFSAAPAARKTFEKRADNGLEEVATIPGQTPFQREQFRTGYGDVTRQYMGALGQALRTGGQAPTFVDYLGDMPWTQRYSSLPPSLRPGGSFQRFAPRTQRVYG